MFPPRLSKSASQAYAEHHLRLPSSGCLRHPGRTDRGGPDGHPLPHRLQGAGFGEAVALRMRLRPVRRRPHALRRPLLSGVVTVHHFRPRGGLPVSLGDRLPSPRPARLLVDDALPRRADGRLRLRMEQGSAGMGLSDGPIFAPAPKGVLDPATGKPVGAGGAFFGAISDELADKGFLVTTTDDL